MTNDTLHNNLPLFVLSNNDNYEKEEEEEELEDTYVLARTSKEKSCFAMFLNTSKVIERTIKHSNVLYICPEEQWKRKVNNYLEQTGIFLYVGDMTSTTSSNATQEILNEMSNLVVKTLHQLLFRRAISNQQYSQMMYYNQSIQFEVNKLDFIPKIRDNKIVIQPMIKCSIVEPMKGILNLVNSLLQVFIRDKLHFNTFPTANEAIEELIRFHTEYYLYSTLFFVTIHVRDLRTTLPHHLMMEALQHFFHYHADTKEMYGTSTTTIVQLIQLFLQNQFCLYEDKLYQQILGSSIGEPLITTLIDIYLFYWQYDLLRRLNQRQRKFFGRCHNQIFFVWKESKDELYTFLNEKNLTHSTHPHIQITVSMNHKIQYLDAEISLYQRILQTRVYHHSNFEPYALPYLSKTKTTSPSQDILLLLRAALIRAILYCSSVHEFENERLYIELSFLLNDVSLYLIQQIMENFFIEYHVMKRDMFINENTYQYLRLQIRENYQGKSEYHLQQRLQRRERQPLLAWQWRWLYSIRENNQE